MNPLTEKFISYLKLVLSYTSLNFKSQLQYRSAFISQALSMFCNNCVWVLFWTLFFNKYAVLKGWTARDVMALWAIGCAGFGLAHSIFGNALQLPSVIARGELDIWMLYPRKLLSHLLLGKMSATAWGDALFGYFIYFAFACPDLGHAALFVSLSLAVSFAYVGFSILVGSLAFFLGNAEILAEQLRGALITFSTFPPNLFDGWFKIVLYSVIPAAYVSYLPVDALHTLSPISALGTALGSLAVLIVGVCVFSFGLSRYESGNLMEMRG